MKKIWCLLLAFFSCALDDRLLAGYLPTAAPLPQRRRQLKKTKDSPKKYSSAQTQAELLWTTGIDPVQPLGGTVEGSTETYVRELTDPKNIRAAAAAVRATAPPQTTSRRSLSGWGLQQLPGLGGWKQSYPTSITAVLPGEAWLVAPDGSETSARAGRGLGLPGLAGAGGTPPLPSPPTTPSATRARASGDAKLDLKGASRRLSLTSGDVANGTNYTNATGTPSRILVSEEVYAQLNQPGYQIRLRLPDAVDELGTAENAVAYLPGRDSTKAVLLGANFDGAGQCGPLLMAGAYNNASGVATMPQTAAWLAGGRRAALRRHLRGLQHRGQPRKRLHPRWPMSWKAATSSCGCSTSSAWAGRATR